MMLMEFYFVMSKHMICQTSLDHFNSRGLLVSIAEEGRLLVEHMSLGNLAPPMPCVASNHNHINLYYKVGHGSLDMYTLNPTLDSKDLKDFLSSWSKYVDSYKGGVPMSDVVGVA